MTTEFIDQLIERTNNRLLAFALTFMVVSGILFVLLYKHSNSLTLLIIEIVFSLLTLLFTFKYILRIVDSKFHPLYKKLKRYGHIETTLYEINQEFSKDDVYTPNIKFPYLKVSDNWIFNDRFFNFDIFKLKDIVHIKREHTILKVNMSKAGDTYSVKFHSRFNDTILTSSRDPYVIQKLIRHILIKTPEINPKFSGLVEIAKENLKLNSTDFTIREKANDVSSDELILEKGSNGLFGFRNRSGTLVISHKFENAAPFSQNMAIVYINNYLIDKYGFINNMGELVVDFIYDFAEDFQEGLALVRKDEKFGFIDKDGNIVIPIIYDNANSFKEGKSEVWIIKEKFFINHKGERL